VILYIDAFWANAWDCGPYVALREKGIPFSTAIALVHQDAGVTPAIRWQAITGLAPALHHGDFWIAESLAIIEYLEDAFPPPAYPRLWPADLRARARARQLLSWTRMEHDELRGERGSSLLFYPRKNLPPLSHRAACQAAELIAVVERLQPSPSGTLFGEWCIADVDLSFALMRLIRTGHDVPAAVTAYAEAVWRRPSVREYVEHSRPPNDPGYRIKIPGP
jgi:glutathione S-transferase